MAVIDSRLRVGTLTLNAVPFACQAKNVTFSPPDIPSGSDDEEVLCGDPLPPDGSNDKSLWKLGVTTIQDFDNPEGLVQFLLDNMGDEVPFAWTANANGFGCSGTVKVWPGVIGGDVKKRLESPLDLPVTVGPVWVPATPTP